MTPVQDQVSRTIQYLEQDLVSFEAVLRDDSLSGKLGVAMITNATAALDLFAWLLYQTYDLRKNNAALFRELVSDKRFFRKGVFFSDKLLYGLVRCGVVHQFYPKNIDIIALDRDDPFVKKDDRLYVNCIGFFRQTLAGLRKVKDYILAASGKELDALDFKLELRARLDESALEDACLDMKAIPDI